MRARHAILAVPVLVGLVAAAAAVLPTGEKYDCRLGNLNPPADLVPGWFTGLERYAYLIEPSEQCDCPVGFQLETITMLLNFDPTMVPVTFQAHGSLLAADLDPSGYFVPGEELCTGPPVMIEILDPGTIAVTVPMDGCPCAAMESPYFLAISFDTPFVANLVVDGFPAPGIAYNDKGTGWVDLYDWLGKTAGKIIVWGDVICCTGVIDTRTGTWGSVKSLYR